MGGKETSVGKLGEERWTVENKKKHCFLFSQGET